ncbi:MAG: thiamine pyrophosphate-requiring protein [Candidatus Tectomicrobia bacterium]|nr:thiamine pyrophosphate-requiring protein [Candidatus Tectomicrobia bacterium]
MALDTIVADTAAEAYLELLRDRGVDYFFGNGGTDFASIVDAFAKFASQGKSRPKPILAPHEMTAVSMAHGYTMVTGRPQVVMVHVIVGTANALAGIMNASRQNVPMLFSAGRTPLTEQGFKGSRDAHIHWAQESFDQGAIVREFVKWDYELRNAAQLETVVDRALTLATAEPAGPVYLSLPREVLAEPVGPFAFHSPSRKPGRSLRYPDPHDVDRAAEVLAAARRPLIITGALGRDPQAVPALVALAETGALPVVEPSRTYLNFPADHPLHLGYDAGPYLPDADAVLVIEHDAPWFPSRVRMREDAQTVHLGVDPYYSRYPIRGYPQDVTLAGTPAAALPALQAALAERIQAGDPALQERRGRIARDHELQCQARRADAERASRERPINPVWVSHCVNAVLDEAAIVVNEYDLVPSQTTLRVPGSFFGNSPASGLGWALGAALGAKLAAPEKTVIATVGDGSYMFNAPTSAHFVSRAQGLPFLTVVFNNQCWNAVRRAAKSLEPDGWAVGTNTFSFCDLLPSPAFEKMMEAHGGYGERVEDPAEVPRALERALRAVREEGRQALLNVICKHPGMESGGGIDRR